MLAELDFAVGEIIAEIKKQDWRKEFFYEHPFVTKEERIPSSGANVTHSEKYIYWP